MRIIEDFIPKGRSNRTGILMNPVYITLHNTGNPLEGSNAKMHAQFFKTTDSLVSWHYTVDDTVIYQHLPLSEVGWHAGDNNGEGHYKSIGIGICMNIDGNRCKAEENTIKLVVYLIKKYSISMNNVVQGDYWPGSHDDRVIDSQEWILLKDRIKPYIE